MIGLRGVFRRRPLGGPVWLGMITVAAGVSCAWGQALPAFDFTQASGVAGWTAAHDISSLQPTTNGLVVSISGDDPYLTGPPRVYPVNQPLWLLLRLNSDEGGIGQVFYYETAPTEANSVRFYVPAGGWTEVRVPVPPLWATTRLRIDPPGSGGRCVLGRLSFGLRPVLQEPPWAQPTPVALPPGTPTVTSGPLSLTHGSSALGAFVVRVNGQPVAIGHNRSMLGYVNGLETHWLTLTNPVTVSLTNGALLVQAAVADPDGGQWQWQQTFQASPIPGGIDVQSRVTVNQPRAVIFLPLFSLLPGVGTFGTNKTQAVFAGVEYLENELSSSEADLVGPAAQRQVPDSLKVTFPLMALAARSNYVGLTWEQQPQLAALHDSPDRLFHSGGHLMGVLFPGSDPTTRQDGSVLPYGGATLAAGQPVTLRATILGGVGATIVPAVQQYVARRGLPPLPSTGYTATDYFTLAAHGWLDSQLRVGALFRHAVGANFTPMPAADAAFYMDWLAAKVPDAALSTRLTNTARDARAAVPPAQYNSAGVGHVRYPVEALAYGYVADNADTALSEGQAALGQFQPDGAVLYQPPVNGLDLSRTSPTREANGLAAAAVVLVLERAAFSGDPALLAQGLRLLEALDKFRATVPRGAQTWEVPLHTPDILASAWLVRAYALGYALTARADWLDQARYWAWTGLPFVYLTPPTPQPVGVYSTIPVFGATQFVAPVWIGLPVQWCGLVYADALRRLARLDTSGPWIQLAEGIAAAGVQQTHPASEPAYQGLLPDSFDLRAQARNPVPINPATLLPEAIPFFGAPPPYEFRAAPHHGLLLHCPGPITDLEETSAGIRFRANGWPAWPWYVLINGLRTTPIVKLNGVVTALQLPHQYQAAQGRLILRLTAPSLIEVLTPARDALDIQRGPTTTTVRLAWPVGLPHCVLEHAGSLTGLPQWRPVVGTILTQGPEQVVTTATAATADLFRLRWQP